MLTVDRFVISEKRHHVQATSIISYEGVTLFWLSTGLDYLQTHLNRIGLANSDQCSLCSLGRIDGNHLSVCSQLNPNGGELLSCISLRNAKWL